MNMEQYKLNLFHLILREMEEKVDFNKCWLKIPSLREMVAFKKLHKFSDDEKKAFVYSFVLIKGVYDLCSIKSIEYKKQGSRFNSYFDIDLPFESDEEREEYLKFRNWCCSVKATSHLLDDYFEL